jgi:hypothetical protein
VAMMRQIAENNSTDSGNSDDELVHDCRPGVRTAQSVWIVLEDAIAYAEALKGQYVVSYAWAKRAG